MLPLKRVRAMSASSDDELDDFQIRFQEAHGSRLFRQGKPRALLEVKSPAFSALSRASFLAPSKSWARCAPRAFSFSRTLVNDSSYENESSFAFHSDSWFLGQCP